jgi:SAM-dependent methyltransferase
MLSALVHLWSPRAACGKRTLLLLRRPQPTAARSLSRVMPPSPADWQLPPGVSRGLWDYLQNPDLARSYDGHPEDCPLLKLDLDFAGRVFARPGQLIDLGCGTGRALLHFARRGYSVLGVDLSAEMLKLAARATAAETRVQLLQANVVELDCLADGSFDYAVCLFSTLGMVSGANERQQVLRHAHRLLRASGKLVLHVHNRWFNVWDRSGRRWLLKDLLRSLFSSKASGDRPMSPREGSAGLALHHFTRREVLRLLRHAGFRILEVQPVSLRPGGRLRFRIGLGVLRAYGYLIAAQRD